jgi:hypothetical protein
MILFSSAKRTKKALSHSPIASGKIVIYSWLKERIEKFFGLLMIPNSRIDHGFSFFLFPFSFHFLA